MQVETSTQFNLNLKERAVAAAGAAFISAVLVNPLDVAKVRLQAQAAGVSRGGDLTNKVSFDGKCPPVCPKGGGASVLLCPPDCFHYKGTWDVFHKIIRQEGLSRLWRGTNVALAIAVPTRKSLHLEPYAPLIAGTIARSLACIICGPLELVRTRMQLPVQSIRMLWSGVGAQLVRDVPFSAICWTTLEPIRRYLLEGISLKESAVGVFTTNFLAGMAAGSIAAAATCPLDVVKTRRQLQKDYVKVVNTSTSQILLDIWRVEGIRGLFMGFAPRVARGGPFVGIVVSFYEVLKYLLHQREAKLQEGSKHNDPH
ncbi:hypothetical protein O6H91_03G026200 [Diphasiastrum complanatum]|uniref:Uncharacterized protein n=1 Tax=Diphasiastrum complanatum TaxID=34168 RepID=A0ACC2E4C1_DIPCM|nr:hypothetical protein O6H91_03G026200 [Diphasiastrum complanatum]